MAGPAGEGRARLELELKQSALKAEVNEKRIMCTVLEVDLGICIFRYDPPEPNFDPSKVMGTVCNIIDVPDQIYCRALECAAEEELFKVVVDTRETAQLLIRKGNLPRHTGFIPLNVSNISSVDRAVVERAQQIGGGPDYVQLGQDLLIYDAKYQAVIDSVFGSTLVVRDFDLAFEMANNPDVKCRAVSMFGDVFDPVGLMTSGTSRGLKLEKNLLYKKLKVALEKAEEALAQCTAELEEADKKHESVEREKAEAKKKAEDQQKVEVKETAEEMEVSEEGEE